MSMQIVIPMSGRGERFRRAGYTLPKPLVEVDGRPMIAHVVELFPDADDFVFICAEDHLESTPLRSVLEELAPEAKIVAIAPHKLGPVEAVLRAASAITDDRPVVLNYCDFSAVWSWPDFRRHMQELGCAGAITTYRGFHPHSLGPNLYAYLRQEGGFLQEIREKGCFTDDRMQEHASAGTYYFASGGLMKRIFHRAVEQNLHTGGEFYASTPYNLMVGEGLPVAIYELERFLQWGTPEDLEEYQGWSDTFSAIAERGLRPAVSAASMVGHTRTTHLIPMAGEGRRFSEAGYRPPKPLVPVAGVPMVQRALTSLGPADRWIVLARNDLAAHPDLASALETDRRRVQIVPVDHTTAGQAATCLLARDLLPAKSPLLIASCDAAVLYDAAELGRRTADPGLDALVWTFRNHPHANRHPDHYGWVDTAAGNRVGGISCKIPLGDNPSQDPGIIGIFWFRTAEIFLEAADRLVALDRRVGGELYVDTLMEVLVEQGSRVEIFDVDRFVHFGTPDDVRTFEYWEEHFHHDPHHPYRRATIP